MCCLLIFTRKRKKRPEKKLVACQFIARLPQTPRAAQLFSFFGRTAHDALHCRTSLFVSHCYSRSRDKYIMGRILPLAMSKPTNFGAGNGCVCGTLWQWRNVMALDWRSAVPAKVTLTLTHTHTLSPYLILVQVCTLSRNGAEVDIFSFIYLETVWYLSEWSH